MSDGDGAAAHGGEAWAGELGENWLAHLDQFESMIAPAGAAALAHAGFAPGERVVDIGCGGGGTTIEIAKRVGARGHATGIDISPVLIEAARTRAARANIANVAFMTADAAVARPEAAPFDRLFSRFGSMFFADRAAAFANLAAMLRPGGRADLAVWAPPAENGWIVALQAIMARHVEVPPADPNAPGPFALANRDYTRGLIEQAGFRDVSFTLWRGEQLVGGAGADAVRAADFVLEAMSFAVAVKHQPGAEAKVRAELIEGLDRHRGPNGIAMSAATWLVTATRS